MKRFLIAVVALLFVGCAKAKTEEAAPAAQANPAPVVPKAAEPDKPVNFKKRVAPLVDKKAAMAENPNLVETKNKITAQNYLSAVAQGYFSGVSQIHLIQLQSTVNTMRELEDRWPTLEEFQKLLNDAGVKLGGLYPHQVYAYDSETGEITILEDTVKRQEMKDAAAW